MSKECEEINEHIIITLKNSLDLSRQQNVLFDNLNSCDNLTSLNLSDNGLTHVPILPTKLKMLDLSGNAFVSVPELVLRELYLLTHLNLSRNNLKDFEEIPVCSVHLIDLNLSINRLLLLPLWIFKSCHCQALRRLNVAGTKCFSHPFPDYILRHHIKTGHCRIIHTLESLNVSYNGTTVRSLQVLSYFKKLTYLNLGNNEISNDCMLLKENSLIFVPQDFPHSVNHLIMGGLFLASLDDQFSKYHNLQRLDLRRNVLSHVPKDFCCLTQLKWLSLDENYLYNLPPEFSQFEMLETFTVSCNKLSSLPETFDKLKRLRFLDAYDNEFDSFPQVLKNIALEGMDFSNNYFSLEDGNYKDMRKNLLQELQIAHRDVFIKSSDVLSENSYHSEEEWPFNLDVEEPELNGLALDHESRKLSQTSSCWDSHSIASSKSSQGVVKIILEEGNFCGDNEIEEICGKSRPFPMIGLYSPPPVKAGNSIPPTDFHTKDVEIRTIALKVERGQFDDE